MQVKRTLEQHIAVFGESGSGKTVLLSSFYGPSQEPGFQEQNLFALSADRFGQGTQLHQNYLGMRDSRRVPSANKFKSTTYEFSVRPKRAGDKRNPKVDPFDSLRLVWHDYPGEWFEQDVEGEEAQRRVDTFRALLTSDVALLLVDAQRLVDNAGEEERYLKSLFANFRNGITLLKDDILPDGQPLLDFPRIWMLGLSKSDLIPELDVFAFRDLVIGKAGDDLNMLRETIATMVQSSDALSVGEDFVLLSSAKFTPEKIELTERVGLDLILPIAAMLPLERHAHWAASKQFLVSDKVVDNLLSGAAAIAGLLIGRRVNLPGRIGVAVDFLASRLTKEHLNLAARLAGEKLKELNAAAIARRDYLAAILTRFRMNLERGERDRVLLRSER
ncbi:MULTISPECIES: TRAFAC clade GTPase domain-containing protein [unclassified Microbacterium]|uniref:TRAFAC clade GTPase domain-containing protein n=1 Tax=Microbacterium TaxID=33882 RepID=UPI003BA015DA